MLAITVMLDDDVDDDNDDDDAGVYVVSLNWVKTS